MKNSAALKTIRLITLTLIIFVQSSCMSAYKKSVGGDTEKAFTRIYLTDFNTAWQSSLEALKSSPLHISNREAGYIEMKWKDNTAQKSFADHYGTATATAYMQARFRFQVTVAEGFYNGKKSVKVSVLKEQLLQNDILEGWRKVITDSIEENTLLYRIGRIILIKMKVAQIEEEKTKQELRSTPF